MTCYTPIHCSRASASVSPLPRYPSAEVPGYNVKAYPAQANPTNIPAIPNTYIRDPVHIAFNIPNQPPTDEDPQLLSTAVQPEIRGAPPQPIN
ncbi:hypothetical protein BO94DRAFT_539998 [Aspergillus sclerotioniger CBS 115572]|uniref:Uncharacterized protein n=1 Tax=Aspergillus sclerotioniger CBS 115572 TaxID=1450535 RepID=A0A317V6H0_9EURO|nr:hypothetical protein BO94DRAFT_539998 [Aspergillus sclerotioniger CBS 115572]PWY69666.1 hypothetical protein BO94DRAFT_539998 [Aspergillus sclerotioniger CBS 115572]